MFELHPRLAEDTVPLGALPLCRVLLALDARYPWVILVPAREAVREIHALSAADRARLIEESSAVAAAMERLFDADKMNVAALGNLVPQLHLHHVARFAHDDAWPAPIWGQHPPLAYAEEALAERVTRLREAFAELAGFTSTG